MGMLDIPSALAMDFEPKDVLEDLETWAAKQEGHPNRSQAIRRLVELGLKAKR
jgi:metal-responsive CopG/Arc/MetJ family transcriptional regulator